MARHMYERMQPIDWARSLVSKPATIEICGLNALVCSHEEPFYFMNEDGEEATHDFGRVMIDCHDPESLSKINIARESYERNDIVYSRTATGMYAFTATDEMQLTNGMPGPTKSSIIDMLVKSSLLPFNDELPSSIAVRRTHSMYVHSDLIFSVWCNNRLSLSALWLPPNKRYKRHFDIERTNVKIADITVNSKIDGEAVLKWVLGSYRERLHEDE